MKKLIGPMMNSSETYEFMENAMADPEVQGKGPIPYQNLVRFCSTIRSEAGVPISKIRMDAALTKLSRDGVLREIKDPTGNRISYEWIGRTKKVTRTSKKLPTLEQSRSFILSLKGKIPEKKWNDLYQEAVKFDPELEDYINLGQIGALPGKKSRGDPETEFY